MSTKWAVQFKLTLEELSQVNEQVGEFGEQQDWQPDLIFHVQLAIDEVGTNVIEHGKDAEVNLMEVSLTSDAHSVILEIADDGAPFDPLREAPSPDVTLSLEDRPIGGLGLHLIRTLTDEQSYQRESGKNLLTLVKRRE